MRLLAKVTIFLAFLVVFKTLLLPFSVAAQSSSVIDATIKISVCGNSIIEGGEDCESADLGGESCESIGFGPGILTCDISCSFITTECSPAPSPSPTPIIPTPSPSASSETDSESNTASQISPEPITTELTITPSPVSTQAADLINIPIIRLIPRSADLLADSLLPQSRSLPSTLEYYDVNKTGKIELSQLEVVVQLWVDKWREFQENSGGGQPVSECDLNSNGMCDLTDFSILMFYIDNE